MVHDLSGSGEANGILKQRMLEKRLGLVADLFGVHAKTKHHGVLNLEYGEFAGEPVQESRGASAVL